MLFNDLIPELTVFDITRSLHFYTELLAFQIEYQRPEAGFAFLSLGAAQLMIEQTDATTAATEEEVQAGSWRTATLEYPLGRGINLSIRVARLDSLLEALHQADYPLKMPPREAWYRQEDRLLGERQFLVLDPDGYLLRFYEDLGEKPLPVKDHV